MTGMFVVWLNVLMNYSLIAQAGCRLMKFSDNLTCSVIRSNRNPLTPH